MYMTCFIEYEIDPSKLAQFNQYSKNWGEIIPRLGGELIGYFMPYEGDNKRAYGLIAFSSLADYESYRHRLRADEQAQANFQFALRERFILHEKRYFLSGVEGTLTLIGDK
ncbi:NIPSNAP family protein [Pseudoalteromonas luteoviolacea]|uniref:NIPSNAP domain-containing protein n=1 Tax=Pseudoalteromonas luteoviolacea S4054 TaxID=1129367 RepID=A0A0F6AD23_9GAMM|nr:NIPSNAP family protein [Pseudoalteromonas luteoviolacea]AOT10623.1 NIPSNAP domain-containing protein [Pseudoalteromonas luteoviolacea]AOT15309.1 NIPSNAP domain-containing protein [Pseudoalteromonas luteoviolacea]AOT20442.1 NIPSNAP domain-containing protein [Pseudoalteromonas luteoviolacea]KKE83721.1 hypothetical protein N479_12910 [Pseudoalteromonas luteoviolacea S4054]KZN71925.1 hypothetical protein N481_17275 [Pseudoalteromonas luteoviolacea S4047-1]